MSKKYIITRLDGDVVTLLRYEAADHLSNDGEIKQIRVQDLISAMGDRQIHVENAALTLDKKTKKLKLQGRTGSLTRFTENKIRPMVVLNELVNDAGKTLGYRIALNNGKIINARLKTILAEAEKAVRVDGIPFQNAVYVPNSADKRAHIKSFNPEGFSKLTIESGGKKYSEPAKVNIEENKKSVERDTQGWEMEQLKELDKGRKAGVNYHIYANKALSADKMKVIREGLEDKLDMKLIASPEFSIDSMLAYKDEMYYGFNIKPYLNPKYTPAQIMELSLGYQDGLNIDEYADPKNSDKEMGEIRLRLSYNLWGNSAELTEEIAESM